MTEILHADIFFFITSVAVIIISLLVSVLLYFAILIARDVSAVTAKIRQASDELEQDFESVRASIKNEGVRIKTFFEFLIGIITRRTQKSRVSKKKVAEPEE